ncbi:MAG TPA: type II secretion system protein GspE [Clostridiales bacterium]|nr:type II secretion system protein GspE [Clostridiales bacterium]
MKKLLGQILIEKGYINEEKLKIALDKQKQSDERLGQVLLSMGIITSEQMLDAMQEQGYKRIDILEEEPDWNLIQNVDEKFMRSNRIVPYSLEDQVLKVVTHDPLNYQVLDYLEKLFGALKVEPLLGTQDEIIRTLDKVFVVHMSELQEEIKTETNKEDEHDDNIELAEGPLVEFIDEIMHRAISQKASDIHIEPQSSENTRIRFRIDGELTENTTVSRLWHKQMVSRIKIMAKLDISKKLEPQDGQITIKHHNGKVDIRVSTLPTLAGEKVVLRIIDKSTSLFDLAYLGFSDEHLDIIGGELKKKQGIILVTGPTGSGKTTTLYSMLTRLNKPNLNISTIEDPVELPLSGINQVQVNKKIGFADALRSLLRQDPDVIMLGEIRDLETAKTAINSSLTGHLFLSTIHTNDSIGVISRMINMGVEPYLLADALKIIISQRLVRKICPKCAQPDEEGLKLAKKMFPKEFEDTKVIYKGKGCPYCSNIGAVGRIGVYEIFIPDDEIAYMVSHNMIEEIRGSKKVVPILQDAIAKVKDGTITLTELIEKMMY